jgi:hypothetical protein
MARAEKLAAKILSGKSDKNFAFNDLCYVLERAGFVKSVVSDSTNHAAEAKV